MCKKLLSGLQWEWVRSGHQALLCACPGSFEDELGHAAVAVDAAASIDVHGDCVRVWQLGGTSVLACLHPLLAEALTSAVGAHRTAVGESDQIGKGTFPFHRRTRRRRRS